MKRKVFYQGEKFFFDEVIDLTFSDDGESLDSLHLERILQEKKNNVLFSCDIEEAYMIFSLSKLEKQDDMTLYAILHQLSYYKHPLIENENKLFDLKEGVGKVEVCFNQDDYQHGEIYILEDLMFGEIIPLEKSRTSKKVIH